MAPVVPVLPYPPEIRDGDFVFVEQDSQADIEGCVLAIASCPQGHLDSMPDMGVRDYALTRGAPPVSEIRAGIEPYEPRVSLIVDPQLEDLVATVTIEAQRADV
jgi:hypothetical protein